MIALGLDEASARHAYQLAETVVTTLDHNAVMHAVSKALKLTTTSTREVRVGSVNYTGDEKQLQEINTLFDLSKSLTEVLDLGAVLSRVVDAARSLTNADEGMILLPEGEELYLRARTGIKVEPARTFRIKTHDTLAGDVYNTGKPILIGASGPQKVKTEYFVNSLVYVPISLQGDTIGVLGINNRDKEDPFDEHHRQLLENLASFAAVAIENARIHQESLERARELETLVAASQVVNSSLELYQTLPNICKQLATVLDVGYSEIFDWNRDEERLNAIARYYQAAWRFGHGPMLDLEENPAISAAIDVDRPVWMLKDDKRYSEDTAHLAGLGAAAMLVIPLRAAGKLHGLVRIYYVKAPEAAPDAENIYHIRQFALQTLVDLLNRTDRIVSNQLMRLYQEVETRISGDWCELSYWVDKRSLLTPVARVGRGVWLEPPYSHMRINQYPDLINQLHSQAPIIYTVDDKEIPPGAKQLLAWSESCSILAIPLVQRGRTEGLVLFADTERHRTFTPREIDMARAIVGQAAMALENSRLVHDLAQSLIELSETQDRLVQTARLSAMGELAAVVAHQINNPLTTIIVDTELLLLDEGEGTPRYEGLMAINRTGKRAANVARRLLTIARPTEPDTPTEPVDVLDSVRGILMLLRTHVERGGIVLTDILPSDNLPKVNAIKGRLDDVWLNLIINAHDALLENNQRDGKITIEVKHVPEASEVWVTVTDNGPGIPPEIRDQIFSPFFTTKPVGEGTGLGLHVCKEVVENSNGTISVESEAGKFTRFCVKLPTLT